MKYASEYAAIVSHRESLKKAKADGVPVYDVTGRGAIPAHPGLASVFAGQGYKPLSAEALDKLIDKPIQSYADFDKAEDARLSAPAGKPASKPAPPPKPRANRLSGD